MLANIASILLSCCIVSMPVIAIDLSVSNPAYANIALDEQREPYSDDRPVILPQVPESQTQEEKTVKLLRAKVALTFDDGPHPVYTPQILDLLKKNNIKATFFLVGVQAKTYPEIAQRLIAEGHEIGSHTQWHLSA
jgi:peptidoglycan/xylan/chitin deacetylase (PgdA/CDA1 family)